MYSNGVDASGPGGLIAYTLFEKNSDDSFGSSVSGAGDVNGDGIADFVIGAPGYDGNGTDAGKAYVYLSMPEFCDGDGVDDVNDVSHVFFHLGDTGGYGISGDANFDGVVDVNDISRV